jgi:tetratricopeptide (TPR) repeat protein
VVDLLSEQGRDADLEPFLLERLARIRRERGPDDYFSGRTLAHLGELYVRQGRHAEGESRFAERLALFKRVLPASHFDLGVAMSDLGGCLVERGAYAEAERLLLPAYDVIMATRRTGPVTRGRVQARLVQLYEGWGRSEEARRWRERSPDANVDVGRR